MKFGNIFESDFDYYKKIDKKEEKFKKDLMTKGEFGIFVWNKENQYPREDAIKIYKSRKIAENAVEKMGKYDYVVRKIFY